MRPTEDGGDGLSSAAVVIYSVLLWSDTGFVCLLLLVYFIGLTVNFFWVWDVYISALSGFGMVIRMLNRRTRKMLTSNNN